MVGLATTVRVLAPTHAQLTELATKLDRSITQVVAEAVAAYARQVFWDECQAAYARLQADPAAWADYQAELGAWEGASADGLEPEDWSAWSGREQSKGAADAVRGQEEISGHADR